MRLSGRTILAAVKVEEGAPVAQRSLAECGLRDQWRTTVLSVKRDGEEFVMPRGTLVLAPGDDLIILTDRDFADVVRRQFKAPSPGAADTA